MNNDSTAGAFPGHRLGETFDRIAPGATAWSVIAVP